MSATAEKGAALASLPPSRFENQEGFDSFLERFAFCRDLESDFPPFRQTPVLALQFLPLLCWRKILGARFPRNGVQSSAVIAGDVFNRPFMARGMSAQEREKGAGLWDLLD